MTMRAFVKACQDSNIDEPFVEGRFHPLVRTLSLWAETNSFEDAAARTKHLIRVCLNFDERRVVCLIQCFAAAFSGSVVGALGRDILEPLLHVPKLAVRQAAVSVLDKWGVDSYQFVEMLADHCRREVDEDLSLHTQSLLVEFGYYDEEEDPDCALCPDCELGEIQEEEGCFVCHECGWAGNRDPRLHDLEAQFGIGELPEDDMSEDPRPELLPWQKVADAATNHMHSALCTGQLPRVVEGLVGIHPHLTIDMIESYKIGMASTRATTLNIFVGPYVEKGLHAQVWFWSDDYAGCIHPLTSTDPEAPERWALEVQWR
jgi:hypothetical protein